MGNSFQFHKVQLKVRSLNECLETTMEFQFHKVQLKVKKRNMEVLVMHLVSIP